MPLEWGTESASADSRPSDSRRIGCKAPSLPAVSSWHLPAWDTSCLFRLFSVSVHAFWQRRCTFSKLREIPLLLQSMSSAAERYPCSIPSWTASRAPTCSRVLYRARSAFCSGWDRSRRTVASESCRSGRKQCSFRQSNP